MSPANLVDVAVPIELPFQVNAQGNAVLVTGSRHCQVFFSLWDEQGFEMARLGKLTFINSWATNSFVSEGGGSFQKADPNLPNFLVRIENSTWLQQCIKQRLARYYD